LHRTDLGASVDSADAAALQDPCNGPGAARDRSARAHLDATAARPLRMQRDRSRGQNASVFAPVSFRAPGGTVGAVCGRFTLTSTPESLARRFGLAEPPAQKRRYNIAPGQDVLAVRSGADGARRAAWLRWGLVPRGSAARGSGGGWINARVETVAERAAFRDAFRARRCLVPADGFFEWAERGGFRQPYRAVLPGGELFAFAGLWEPWGEAEGPTLESCAILTQDASPGLRALHDRMPVVLPPEAYAPWLDPTLHDVAPLRALLRAAGDPGFATYPVSTRVNQPRFDDPACVEPVAEPPLQTTLF
jgi:putative SOS response-associated peptidase YedK